MASKADAAAAKQRQQKMILIVGGVLLAGLLVLQGPKLMKQLKGSKTAAPAAATDGSTTPGATGTTTTTGGVTTPVVGTVGRGPAAEVAGVVIRQVGAPAAGTGQIGSLSRFKAKDPFVQQVSDGSTGGGGGAASGTTGTTGATTPGSVTGTVTPTTGTPEALGYATLMVNGKIQQLQLKQLFPKGQPTFVLLAVGKTFIKVGVAGGKFSGGGVVKLERGKRVTLMNTTTGQRFVMKLTFTGATPEEIAGFKQPTTSTGTTTTTTSPTATTTPTTKAPSTVSATTSAYTP